MRSTLAIKSSIIGLLAKLASIVLSFISSRLFIRYLGVEILGVNGVFSNIIGFLQLAELGIGSAITYSLYQPLVDGDINEIRALMQLFRKLYAVICVAISAVGVIIIPFLRYIITDISYSWDYIINVYLIQVSASVSTYIMAYRRNLLYADEKQYVSTTIDAILNVFFTAFRIASIFHFKSYVIFLCLTILQNLCGNIAVTVWTNKQYPFLNNKTRQVCKEKNMLKKNVWNIMFARLACWVYGSTDNLIISRFVGIASVGLMANYYVLKNLLTSLASSIVEPITPMLGKHIRECDNKEITFNIFLTYTFVRFVLSDIICVGFILIGNSIISIWLGNDFVLKSEIPILLAIDMFISMTHGPTGELITVKGLFSDEKKLTIIGMLINLFSSLVLVHFFGIVGVLTGTVLAQIYYWIARVKVVFTKYFVFGLKQYCITILKYITTMVIQIFLLGIVFNSDLFAGNSVFLVLLKCVICGFICIFSLVISNNKSMQYNMTKSIVQQFLRERKSDDSRNQLC